MLISALIILGKILLVILGLTALYFIMAYILGKIPFHSKFQNQTSDSGIEIFILSNGVHTDFALPIKHIPNTLLEMIDLKNFELTKEELNHIAFGWGERGFYLDIPTWADLTFKIAFKAVMIPSPTLMHVKAYDKFPDTLKQEQKLIISQEQFKILCDYIPKYFKRDKNQKVIFLPGKGYTPNDNFYEANGKYHMFNTCNYWVNRGLRIMGVRTPVWSPMDKSIFHQLEKVENAIPKTST